MENYKEKIDKFISFFHKQLDIICNANFYEGEKAYKKMLYIGIIDTISKSVYPQKSNRDRFVSFIRLFSDWSDCERVSLPHLARLLEKVPDTEFSKLRAFVLSNFNWKDGDVIYLDKDPDFKTVQSLWPKDKEYLKPIGNVQLEFLIHGNLLYTYRNSLIHELREPGYGMEFKDDDSPLYHSMIHIDDNNRTSWELVYPLGFFESLCATVLKKLETYLIDNKINPYNFFTFGTYWIGDLNS